jgi:hypothetical protein
MSVGTKSNTKFELEKLRDEYPNLYVESPDQWKRRITAYHAKLRKFDDEVVTQACEQVAELYPDRFPTAGQIAVLCARIDRETTEARRQADEEEKKRRENESIREHTTKLRVLVVPDSREEQCRWMAEDPDPFGQLARQFEAESKNADHDPTEASPPGVARRRLDQIFGLMRDWGEVEACKS